MPKSNKTIAPFPAPSLFKKLTGLTNGGQLGLRIMRWAEHAARDYLKRGGELRHPETKKFVSVTGLMQAFAEQTFTKRFEARKQTEKLQLSR